MIIDHTRYKTPNIFMRIIYFILSFFSFFKKNKYSPKIKSLLLSLLFIKLYSTNAYANDLREVILLRVIDGDTVHLINKNNRAEVFSARLALIDAPESDQQSFDGRSIGLESKKFLQKLIMRKKIWVKILGEDRYKRKLARLYRKVDHSLYEINQEMIKNGHALIYEHAKFENFNEQRIFFQLQNMAMLKKSGFWGSSGFFKPSFYRKLKKKIVEIKQ